MLFGAVRLWALGPALLAIELGGLFWIVRILDVREVPVVFSAMGAPVVAVAAYGVIRYGLSEVEPVAGTPMMLWVAAILLFFLLLNNVRHRWHVTAIVWVLTSTGTFVALYSLWQTFSGSSFVWAFPQPEQYLGRASGTFLRPSHAAAYLQMVFPVGAATFLFSRRTFEQKVVIAVGSLVMGAALLLIDTPNGWLGWLASMIVLLIYIGKRGGKRSRWLVVGVALLGLLLLATLIGILAAGGTVKGSGAIPSGSPSELWHTAWQMARARLFLGIGPGMFQWLYPAHRTMQGVVDTPGNEYGSVFVEFGLIGLGLIAWTLVAFVVAAVHILSARAARYSASTPSNRYAFAVGGLASVVGVAVGSLFDSSLHAPANLFALVAITAATLTCGIRPSGKIEEDEALPGRYAPLKIKGVNKVILTLTVAMAMLVPGWRLYRTYLSDIHARLGRRASEALDWDSARDDYVKAWKYDRRNFEVTTAVGDLQCAQATWNSAQREKLLNDAIIWYERAVTANPYATDVQIRIGRVYDALGKRELAEERYRRAVEADPQNASYQAQLALHHQRWAETNDAVAGYARAYELGGDDPLPEIELRGLGKLGS
ncbi:MAG TPA: O-antigen ligase family protein [Verrucomicrobiae bacterium]|nr:O-antigen ligase family protein [Verrucomicrobiae bacterium]